jgi:DNA ligase (NAD+)
VPLHLDNATISDYEFDIKLKKQLQDLKISTLNILMKVPSRNVLEVLLLKILKQYPTSTECILITLILRRILIDWENAYRKYWATFQEYTCELKYDGASISITYENGKPKRAVTRGDGFQGMMLPIISK